jgi:hypothetical protein
MKYIFNFIVVFIAIQAARLCSTMLFEEDYPITSISIVFDLTASFVAVIIISLLKRLKLSS